MDGSPGSTFVTQRARTSQPAVNRGHGRPGSGGTSGSDSEDEGVREALRPGPPRASDTRGPGRSKVTQSTLLAHKLREMEKVQAQLESKKQEYHDRMSRCRDGEARLAEKQASIRASVVQFDKFVKDNDQKRKRANQRAKDEVQLTRQKDAEIEALKVSLRELIAKKEASEALLKRDEMFFQYITSVCDHDKHATWESHEAIINRYAILEAANADLVTVASQHDVQIERLKRELLEYTKSATDEILFLNNQLTREQSKLDALRGDSGDVEHRNFGLEEDSNERTRLLGQVRMAIANIHNRARPKRAVHRSNLNEMLTETRTRISDLIHIEKVHKDKGGQNSGGDGGGHGKGGGKSSIHGAQPPRHGGAGGFAGQSQHGHGHGGGSGGNSSNNNNNPQQSTAQLHHLHGNARRGSSGPSSQLGGGSSSAHIQGSSAASSSANMAGDDASSLAASSFVHSRVGGGTSSSSQPPLA